MAREPVPTQLKLLDSKTIIPGLIKEVTLIDTFEGMTQNLNDHGLFSATIFGKLGSKERDVTEGFIDTRLEIFNPTYLKALIQIKGLYLGILKGTEYAVWDPKLKDFIKSNILSGETGFTFFLRHFKELLPSLTESHKRKQRVELINKGRDKALIDKVIVLPAGMRDIQFQPTGAPVEPEITELYKKLLFRTSVLSSKMSEDDKVNPLYDTVRWGIQNAFNEIDKYIFDLQDGKGGVHQRRMATRGVSSGTRNIITARKVSRSNLFAYDGVNPNTTDLGLFQCLSEFSYVCIHGMLTKYLSNIFTQGSQTAKLVDPKTLSYSYVELEPDVVEKWSSADGIMKLFNGFGNVTLRNKVIKLSGNYLALVYDDGENVCVLNDINDLPEGKNKNFVRPITYAELFYLSCQSIIVDQLTQQTRYPIIGIGSIFPSKPRLITSHTAKPRIVRDINWGEMERCDSYPDVNKKTSYYDAMSVDPSREKGLDSDHD